MRGILSFLLVIVIAFFVIGYFRGWYTASETRTPKDSESHGKINLNLGIDEDKIGKDLHAAKNRVAQATENLTGTEHHADGTIMDVEKPNFSLQLSDGKRLPMKVASSAEGELDKTHVGDHVSVDYREKDGKNVASSIRVQRNN